MRRTEDIAHLRHGLEDALHEDAHPTNALERAQRAERLDKTQRRDARKSRRIRLDEANHDDDKIEPIPTGAQVGVGVHHEALREHLEAHLHRK